MKHLLTPRAILLASALAIAPAAWAETPADTLVVAAAIDDIISLDPAQSFEFSGNDVNQNTYDRLVDFDPLDMEAGFKPSLAESWEVSEDGTEYTFKLRQGVKFHSNDRFTPTRDFNADDVVFSFQRQGDPNHPWHQYIPGITYEYYTSMDMPNLLKSVEKVDDYTVKFTLNQPEAPFLANIAMPFASIVSKEYADTLEAAGAQADLNNLPIGTGPFRFVAYQKDAVIRYQKNADYWGEAPKIDDLIFAITPDPSVRLQKLKAGECHLMPYPSPADLESIRADDSLKLDEQPGLNVGYLAYNTTVAPFDNPKVRKALNMAINKEAIIDAVFQGAAEPAKNPIPPTMWS